MKKIFKIIKLVKYLLGIEKRINPFLLARQAYKYFQNSLWINQVSSESAILVGSGLDQVTKNGDNFFEETKSLEPSLFSANREVKTGFGTPDGNWSIYETFGFKICGHNPTWYFQEKVIKDSIFYSEKYDRIFFQLLLNLERKSLKREKKISLKSNPDKKYCLLDSNWNNYSHFIMEHIPKLRYIEMFYNNFNDFIFIVESNCPQWKIDILTAVGVNPISVVEWNGIDLKVITGIITTYPKLSYSNFTWLREKIISNMKIAEPNGQDRLKIYLSRNKGPETRRICNELELINFLKKNNFVIVYPEQLTFLEQFKIFNRAKLVVGPHGSGMVNIFAAKNISVIEFFDDRVALGFRNISKILGFNWNFLFCDKVNKNYMKVPLNKFKKILSTIE